MTTVGQLDSFFTGIINDTMKVERQPLVRLQQQVDTINVKRGAYTDANTKLLDLQNQIRLLESSNAGYALSSGRTVSVSDPSTAGATVLSATAGSTSIPGSYRLENIVLAKEQRVRSDQQVYSDQALGKNGTILIGGAADRSVQNVSSYNYTITGSGTAALASGQTELGKGDYYIETRNDPTNGWQFRLVDTNGNAINIQEGSTSSYGNNWQSIPTGGGTYNTGRGLTINFGTDHTQYQAGSRASTPSTAMQLTYTAQGAQLSILTSDSLNAIADKINNAAYAQGDGIVASIVDRQLVLTSALSGTAHTIQASDKSGAVLSSLGFFGVGDSSDVDLTDGFKHTLQVALNSSFTINGISISRSKNSGISDVIAGVTINLAADAQGKSATLNVSSDWGTGTSAINSFLTKFNTVTAYLQAKTAVTSQTDGTKTTYTRGTLADDDSFSQLRGDLFAAFMSNNYTSTGGAFQSLRDIGLNVGSDMQATVVDNTKLQTALQNNFADVKSLLDKAMGAFDTLLGRFTGSNPDGTTSSTGYLSSVISNYTDQINDNNDRISALNIQLNARQQALVDQYAQMQALLTQMSYDQQSWKTIYGATSSLA